MGNIDRSRLAKELEPYIASQIRSMLNAALTKSALPTLKASGGGGLTAPAPLTTHVLATATALGAYHTISGATAGHVLRATASNAAAFAQLLHSDLGNVTADQHHNQSHAYDSADHTGTLSWSKINFTGSSLGDLATRNYAQLNSRTHDIIGGDHSYTGGAALDVFGLSGASTLARLTPSDSVSSVQTAILKATNGALSIDVLTAVAKVRSPLLDTAGVAHMTVAPGGRLILSPGEWVQLTDGKTIRSESFASGFVGNGFRLDQGVSVAGQTSFEVDNLWVRGRMHIYELLIHQIRATNGSIFVSNTGKVVDVSGSGPYTLTTDPEHGFAVGDLIRAQRFTGTGVYQCNMQVTSVTDAKVFVATLSSGDAPAAGMDFARLGSASDANRRGGLYLTADDSGAPFMDIFDGVSSFATWNTPGVIKSRLGKLDGLGLPGSYTGEYGLYAGNGTTDADAYVRLSNKTSRFNNVPLQMWSGGVQVGQWSSNGQLDIGFSGISTLNDRDFTVHASGYVRIGRVGANMPNLLYTAGGDLELRSNTTPVITLAADGSSYFSGPMSLGSGGGIYQGTGTFASPTTGLKIWNDSGIGRLAGYNGGNLQVGFDSNGRLSAGGGDVRIDANGITLTGASTNGLIRWNYSTYVGAQINWTLLSSRPALTLSSTGFLGSDANIDLTATPDTGGTGTIRLTANVVEVLAAFSTPFDTSSGVTLELKQDTTSILRSQKTSADAYLRLGNGRTVDGLAYFDLMGDGAGGVGIRFLRNGGANGASQLLHYGTGVLQISTQNAGDLQLRTNATERMRILSDGLVKVENSIAVNGDYGGTAGYTTFTDATNAAGGAGGGTVKMNDSTGRNNSGFIKAYVGTQAVYIPYWNTVG